MAKERVMTLRLGAEQAEQVELTAAVEGQTVSDLVRAAIAVHVEGRRRDPVFQAALRRYLARMQDMLT